MAMHATDSDGRRLCAIPAITKLYTSVESTIVQKGSKRSSSSHRRWAPCGQVYRLPLIPSGCCLLRRVPAYTHTLRPTCCHRCTLPRICYPSSAFPLHKQVPHFLLGPRGALTPRLGNQLAGNGPRNCPYVVWAGR